MRRLLWLLIPVGVIGLLAMIAIGPGTVWINSFVHSDAFRHEVEAKASQASQGTVEIKQIDFSIWSGVELTGLATKLNTPQGMLVAQVESVNCSYSLMGLLRRRLEFNAITLVKPQLVLTQQAPSTVSTPTPPTTPGAKESTSAEANSGNTAPFQLFLEEAKISDGRLSIRDATSATKADLQGVQVTADTSNYYNGKVVTGKLRIATVSLPQNLSLTDFSTPFTYRDGAVQANPFEASAFSGKISGDYALDPKAPSLLDVNATGLDVAQIGKTANPNSSTTLTGSLALQSKWHGVETGKLSGDGDAQITNGKLEGIAMLHDLASLLRVKELSEPILKSVTVHFQVADGATRFTSLRIESNVFEITGQGTIDPQGKLDADLLLALHGNAMGAIPGAITSVFSKIPGGGGSIPIHIGGTVSNPQTNLSAGSLIRPSKVEKSVDKAIIHLFH